VTLRFVGRPEADESTWQERVIGHLGLADWLRVEVSDETDLVGPVAQESLLRHGPLYPANAHSVVPALGALRGGSLLTGQGGDEVLGGHRWTPLNEVLGRRRRPGRHDATRLLTAALPRPVRGRVTRGLAAVGELPWLRLDARKQAAGLARRRPDEPVRFDRAVAAAAQGRGVLLAVEAFQRVARAHGVTAGAPLIDSRFIGALAHAGGRTGWGGRRAVMTAVAGDALPSELIERRTKADFTRCFFGQHSHEFARGWSGKGLDESLVDADAVRMAWLGKNADFRAAMLLQSAWLHERADTEPLTRAA
jgi:asparagine synthase (glutamine-hydrolysing)